MVLERSGASCPGTYIHTYLPTYLWLRGTGNDGCSDPPTRPASRHVAHDRVYAGFATCCRAVVTMYAPNHGKGRGPLPSSLTRHSLACQLPASYGPWFTCLLGSVWGEDTTGGLFLAKFLTVVCPPLLSCTLWQLLLLAVDHFTYRLFPTVGAALSRNVGHDRYSCGHFGSREPRIDQLDHGGEDVTILVWMRTAAAAREPAVRRGDLTLVSLSFSFFFFLLSCSFVLLPFSSVRWCMA